MSRELLPLLAAAALALLIAGVCGHSVEAQRRDDALDLARLCVHEAGWDSPDDCTGIYTVIANGAAREGMSWGAFARVYSRRFFTGTSAQVWASRIYPEHGVRGTSWSWTRPRLGGLPSRRDAFAALLEHCRNIFGRPTTSRATDWGSEEDMEARAAQGRRFSIVDLGETRNIFSVRRGLE